ncbi:DUF4129 domain-containing protein [Halovivax sp.]|uniref:DUF4129 domain-containing protein n=1 Tax=Halovivax sp. TaxID=1935978 RepID=UPI0025C543F1|nr:DUF4129 domain-containing protein [Halovivax sp.]
MLRKGSAIKLATALLGIVAVALAAATASSPFEGGGSAEEMGSGSNGATEVAPLDVPTVVVWIATVVAAAVAIVATLYLLRHFKAIMRTSVGTLVAILLYFPVAAGVVFLVDMVGGDGPDESRGAAAVTEPVGDVTGGDPQVTMVIALLLPFFAWFVVFGLVLLYTRGRFAPFGEREDDDGPDVDVLGGEVAGIADAAGRAVDRITESDPGELDNEIYRAWLEMTKLLDVDRPATCTPGEFADAAVDAGLERHHVEELTGLFEEVRYGAAETTRIREDRAVQTLERIENAYGTERQRGSGDGR